MGSFKCAYERSEGKKRNRCFLFPMKILSAQNIRSMNEERIRRYKDESAIGEGRDGNLKYRTISVYERFTERRLSFFLLLRQENNAKENNSVLCS